MALMLNTLVSVSSESLLTAFDIAIGDGSITTADVAKCLSPNTLKELCSIVVHNIPHKDIIEEMDNPDLLVDIVRTNFNIKELLSESDIEDIQEGREIDIDEILDNLTDEDLISHIEYHRSPKDFICNLVNSL